jgi:hypothetical protein
MVLDSPHSARKPNSTVPVYPRQNEVSVFFEKIVALVLFHIKTS